VGHPCSTRLSEQPSREEAASNWAWRQAKTFGFAAACRFRQQGDRYLVPTLAASGVLNCSGQRPGLRRDSAGGQAAFEARWPPCCVRLASG